MKSPRAAVGVTVLDGKIHAIGGRGIDNTFTVGTHESYDPATGTWNELSPLPKARDHLAVVAAEGKIHAIGGRITTPTDRTGEHDIYDPKTIRGPARRRCRPRAAGSPTRSTEA